MNLGQTMLTAGMLMLLVMSVISANRMINENTGAQFEAEALASSASIANDLLLEIMSKRFDGKSTIDSTDYVKGILGTFSFSQYDSLHILDEWGPSKAQKDSITNWPDRLITEPTDSVPHFQSLKWFNDVDDYDGYQRTVNFGNITGFIVKVKVCYVAATTPDVFSLSRTNFKRIEVSVEHPLYLPKVTYTALASY